MTTLARALELAERFVVAAERIADALQAPRARALRRDGSPAVVPTVEDHEEVSRRRAARSGTPSRRRRAA